MKMENNKHDKQSMDMFIKNVQAKIDLLKII